MKNRIITLLGLFLSTTLVGQNLFDSTTIHLSCPNEIREQTKPQLFNYNPITTKEYLTDFEFKNELKNSSTLFVAFSNEKEDKKDLLNLTAGKDIISISNRGIINNSYQTNLETKDGIILCYQFCLRKTKKNNLISLKDYKQDTSTTGNHLLELLYFPLIVDDITRSRIESYLSIKYGISLTDTANYINSSGDTIWNYQENERYNHRVTGIGRDDNSSLCQKQSQNSKFKGFIVGLNKIDHSNLSNSGKFSIDKTFLLWGDNDGSIRFQENASNPSKIDRVWKINYVGRDSINTTVGIDTSYFTSTDVGKDDNIFWMIGSESDSIPLFESDIYQQDSSPSEIIQFKDITFHSNEIQYVSFIKAPKFFAVHRLVNSCTITNSWNIDLKILGGEPPYLISLSSNNDEYFISDSSLVFLTGMMPGNYILKIRDNQGKYYTKDIQIYGINSKLSIAKEWVINDKGYADIFPNEINKGFSYMWFDGNKLLSSETECRLFEEGNYFLKITDDKGCYQKFDFAVSRSDDEMISVFPNPALRNKLFTIRIKLPELGNHVILITDMNGKIIKKITRSKLDPRNFQESLPSPGKYTITLISNNKTFVSKLIVI